MRKKRPFLIGYEKEVCYFSPEDSRQSVIQCFLSVMPGHQGITLPMYDSGSYMDVFEQDIVESEKKIIVSSPEITEDKVDRFLCLVKARQEAGCKVMVITTEPQNIAYGSPEFCLFFKNWSVFFCNGNSLDRLQISPCKLVFKHPLNNIFL